MYVVGESPLDPLVISPLSILYNSYGIVSNRKLVNLLFELSCQLQKRYHSNHTIEKGSGISHLQPTSALNPSFHQIINPGSQLIKFAKLSSTVFRHMYDRGED